MEGKFKRFYALKDSDGIDREAILCVLDEIRPALKSRKKSLEYLSTLFYDIIEASVDLEIINESILEEICGVSVFLLEQSNSDAPRQKSFGTICDALMLLLDIAGSLERSSRLKDMILYLAYAPLINVILCFNISRDIELMRLAFKCLNFILAGSSTEGRLKISRLDNSELTDILDLLGQVGDYDLQVSIVETIFRLLSKKERRQEHIYACLHPYGTEIVEAFINISRQTFDVDVRNFLIKINDIFSSEFKVHSYPCLRTEVSGQPLSKPRDENYNEFWVDFNEGSKCVFINCLQSDEEMEASWDALTIKDENAISVHLSRSNQETKVELKLKNSASSYFDSSTATAFVGKEVEIFFDPKYELESILKKIFGNNFKRTGDNQHSISSSSRSSFLALPRQVMYDRRKEIMYDRKKESTEYKDIVNVSREAKKSQSFCPVIEGTPITILNIPNTMSTKEKAMSNLSGEEFLDSEILAKSSQRTECRQSSQRSNTSQMHREQSPKKEVVRSIHKSLQTMTLDCQKNILGATQQTPSSKSESARLMIMKKINEEGTKQNNVSEYIPPSNKPQSSVNKALEQKSDKNQMPTEGESISAHAHVNPTQPAELIAKNAQQNTNTSVAKATKARRSSNKRKLFNETNNFMEVDPIDSPMEQKKPKTSPKPSQKPKKKNNKFFKSTPLTKNKTKGKEGQEEEEEVGFLGEVSAIETGDPAEKKNKLRERKKVVSYMECTSDDNEDMELAAKTNITKKPSVEDQNYSTVYDIDNFVSEFRKFSKGPNLRTYGCRGKSGLKNKTLNSYRLSEPEVIRDDPAADQLPELEVSSPEISLMEMKRSRQSNSSKKRHSNSYEACPEFLPEFQPFGEEENTNRDSGVTTENPSHSMEENSHLRSQQNKILKHDLIENGCQERGVLEAIQLILSKLEAMETSNKLQLEVLVDLLNFKSSFNKTLDDIIDKIKHLKK